MTRRVRLPDETFRLYPWPFGQQYFSVYVAPTFGAMCGALINAFGVDAVPSGIVACVCNGPLIERGDMMGMAFFSRTDLRREVVAHELSHVAFRALEWRDVRVKHWVRQPRKSVKLRLAAGHDSEEQFATILGLLTQQFWQEACGRGLA